MVSITLGINSILEKVNIGYTLMMMEKYLLKVNLTKTPILINMKTSKVMLAR